MSLPGRLHQVQLRTFEPDSGFLRARWLDAAARVRQRVGQQTLPPAPPDDVWLSVRPASLQGEGSASESAIQESSAKKLRVSLEEYFSAAAELSAREKLRLWREARRQSLRAADAPDDATKDAPPLSPRRFALRRRKQQLADLGAACPPSPTAA